MHMKFVSLIAGTAIILAGCASQNNYPLTGAAASAGDPVHFMAVPDVAHY